MAIDFESTAWDNLREDFWFGKTLAGYSEPRDRVADVCDAEVGIDGGFL